MACSSRRDAALQSSCGRDVDSDSIRCCVIWITAVAAVFSIALLVTPESRQKLSISGLGVTLPELCTMRRLTGFDCPGCGLTRSFVLAVRFRLADAWAMHPVGTLLVGYLAASVAQRLWRLKRLLGGRPSRSTAIWELGLVCSLVAAAYVRWAVLWFA
jgi:hypothetical protein